MRARRQVFLHSSWSMVTASVLADLFTLIGAIRLRICHNDPEKCSFGSWLRLDRKVSAQTMR